MQNEWLEWLKAISPIVTLAVSALLSVVTFLGKKMIDGFIDQLKTMNVKFAGEIKAAHDEHEELEKDFLKFQAQLPRVYVLKDDHIRHITIVEKKIDDHAGMTQAALSSLAGDVKLLLRETPKRKGDG